MNKINGLNECDIYLICSSFVNLCDDRGSIPYNFDEAYKKAFHSMELFEKALKRRLTEKSEDVYIYQEGKEDNGEEG